MSIEIPDWVLEAATKALFEDQCPLDQWTSPMEEDEREDWRDGARKVLRAALEGWLEPRGYLITWEISDEQVVSARPAHQDDGTTETLYLLRKDKTP